jgi:hypothetical protein
MRLAGNGQARAQCLEHVTLLIVAACLAVVVPAVAFGGDQRHSPADAEGAIQQLTETPSTTPTSTATDTPTVTPTPTSFRVADVAVTIDDDRDPVLPGDRLLYEVRGVNNGPATAPNGMIDTRTGSGWISFTGVFTPSFGSPILDCTAVGADRISCHMLAVYAVTVQIEAEVSRAAPPSTVEVCSSIAYVSPGGGSDPNPANNHDCETTEIRSTPATPGPSTTPTATGEAAPGDRRLYLPRLDTGGPD